MDIKVFETYEEAGEFLKKLQGDKDFLEIVERTKDKRFKEFIKLTFSKNIDKNSAINKISDVLKGQELISKNVGEIANVLNHTQILNSFNVFVSSANLVSTVVGFAIMNEKLKDIKKDINAMWNDMKKMYSIKSDLEVDRVISEYKDMLDHRRPGHTEFDIERYRKLISEQSNILKYLIQSSESNVSYDSYALTVSIFSLVLMMSTTIIYFDRAYFNKYKEWHLEHNDWLSNFDYLLSDAYKQKVQDYAFINENLNQHVTDIFVNDFIEQISNAKKAIEDNQQILIACKTKELFNELQNQINNDLKDEYDNIRQTELKNYIPELNEEYSSQLAMMA